MNNQASEKKIDQGNSESLAKEIHSFVVNSFGEKGQEILNQLALQTVRVKLDQEINS